MKQILVLFAILLSYAVSSQELKPKFEKEGDVIKGTFYYEDGSISQQGFYNKEGKLEGEWKSYDREGNKIALGKYTNGVKTGKWFFWNDNKLSEVNYDNNTIASVTTWSNKSDVVVNFNN